MSFSRLIDTAGYALAPGVIADDLEAWREAVSGSGSANARNLLAIEAVARLAESLAVRGLVEPVLGPSARPVRGLLFDKREGENWGVGWHQDTVIAVAERPEAPPSGFESWSVKQGVTHVRPPTSVLAGILTVRLALDEADESNGCLKVLPGSHREGVLIGDQINDARNRYPKHACVTSAGDALLMRPLLLHASGKATRPERNRRVVHLEFAAGPLPEPLRWATWDAEQPATTGPRTLGGRASG